jgi:hypothetical protein
LIFSRTTKSKFKKMESDREMNGMLGAIIRVAPGAVAGGIIGGIFTKRHFRIQGDMKKLDKMFETLKHAEK